MTAADEVPTSAPCANKNKGAVYSGRSSSPRSTAPQPSRWRCLYCRCLLLMLVTRFGQAVKGRLLVMSTPPRNTEIWTCPCMLYWTTLPGGVGHYPVQSKLFFVQLEGFLVSQSRIPVNLLVECYQSGYTSTASTAGGGSDCHSPPSQDSQNAKQRASRAGQ